MNLRWALKILAGIFLLSIFIFQQALAAKSEQYIISNPEGAPVYPFPFESAVLPLISIPFNTLVDYLDREGAWFKVTTKLNDTLLTGWIDYENLKRITNRDSNTQSNDLQEIHYTRPTYMTTKSNSTAIRESPEHLAKVLGLVDQTTPLEVTAEYGYWRKVKSPYFLKTGTEDYLVHESLVGWVFIDNIEPNINAQFLFKKGLAKELTNDEKKQIRFITELKKLQSTEELRQKEIEALELSERIISEDDHVNKLQIYQNLLKLDSQNKEYQQKARYYSKKIQAKEFEYRIRQTEKDRAECVKQGYLLALLSWHWSASESNYAIVEGEVINLTEARLENILVTVSWYNIHGQFITSSSSHIDYKVLMPGQASPFKVYTPDNSQMSNAEIEFKKLFSGTIPTCYMYPR